jgi:hypothetical protein
LGDRLDKAVDKALIKFALLTGAADSATVGITCTAGDGTALALRDKIIACVNIAVTENTVTDITANAGIIAGGKLTVPDSANDKVGVWWMSCSAERQCSSPFIQSEIGTGALANTSITVTGISLTDKLISVIEFNTSTGAWTDRTAASSIYAADTVRCTSSTNGNSIYVLWMDESGPRGFSSFLPRFGIATLDASPTAYPSTATLTGIKENEVILSVFCVDETDYDILDDLTSVTTASADDTLTISEPSPSMTVSAKLLVFYQGGVDR